MEKKNTCIHLNPNDGKCTCNITVINGIGTCGKCGNSGKQQDCCSYKHLKTPDED